MHNLLELIKKEQDVYNIVFNELIRQVCFQVDFLLDAFYGHTSDYATKLDVLEFILAQKYLATIKINNLFDQICHIFFKFGQVKNNPILSRENAYACTCTHLDNAIKNWQKLVITYPCTVIQYFPRVFPRNVLVGNLGKYTRESKGNRKMF